LKIARFLGQNGIPNFWISGNHDVLEDGTGNTTLTPLAEAKLDKTVVFEEPGALTVPNRGGVEGGFLFCALPFVARSRAYDPHAVVKGFGERSRGTDTFHVVLGHLQVEGALLGSETLDMPRGRDVRFPVEAVKLLPRRFCLNGHYHKRQQVGEVFMPGSLERLSFGEEQNQPGCAIVEV
jgi:DNA repair exonuclease SbcCD nuclease subunit